VRAGQKGIRILAPIVGVCRKKDADAQKDITKQNERILLGFRNAYVFDISQTDGVDLPEMREVSGDPGESIERLTAFLNDKGIAVSYNDNIAPALGMSYGGRIVLLPGQSKAETFSTLVHEAGHELLHRSERRTATTKIVRETEAEAVAFVVGKAVGLVTGSASADYIQLYKGNASLLAESLEVVQQIAGVILAALEPPLAENGTSQELEEIAA
jgi:antirestriction protein ArdC